MTAVVALVAVAVAVLAFAAYALVRRRGHLVAGGGSDDEFEHLNEAERCDYLFALSALDDPSKLSVIRRSLDDPSETVAIAAARSLIAAGRGAEVEALLEQRHDERAQRIAAALELLA